MEKVNDKLNTIIGLICIVAVIICFNLIISYGISDSPESSLNTLKIPFNRIVEIDTSITYECLTDKLDSLKEIKTIKIIYK